MEEPKTNIKKNLTIVNIDESKSQEEKNKTPYLDLACKWGAALSLNDNGKVEIRWDKETEFNKEKTLEFIKKNKNELISEIKGENINVFPARIKSKALNETFVLYENGDVIFEETNIKYTESEWKKLEGLSAKELQAVHDTKLVFKESTVTERRKT